MTNIYHNYLYNNFSNDFYRSHHYHEDVISRHRQINNWNKQQQQQQQQSSQQQQQQQLRQQQQQIQHHPSSISPIMITNQTNFDVENQNHPAATTTTISPQFGGDLSLPSYSAILPSSIGPIPSSSSSSSNGSRLVELQDFQILPNNNNNNNTVTTITTNQSPYCQSIHFDPNQHYYHHHPQVQSLQQQLSSKTPMLPPSSTSQSSSSKSSMKKIFNKMTRTVAKHFLDDERDRKYYADMYSCMPPPFFILTITLVELIFFAYYTIVNQIELTTSGPIPTDSIFIYRPDRKNEIWRFFLYMVLHAGWLHLIFNLIVQLLVGLPLEMVHGSTRIGIVYMSGVLAGSLATSVFDPNCYLVGASGGVYALLAAHLSNVLLNYNHLEMGLLRVLGVFLIASVDVSIAIYHRYAIQSDIIMFQSQPESISYVAHLAGALAGLTIGLLVLKNFEQKLHEQLLWWMALGVYTACIILALLFNIIN